MKSKAGRGGGLKLGVALACASALAMIGAGCDVQNGYLVQDGKRVGEVGNAPGGAVAVYYRKVGRQDVAASQITLDVWRNHVRNGAHPAVAAQRTLQFLRRFCPGGVAALCLKATGDEEVPEFLWALQLLNRVGNTDCLAVEIRNNDERWTTRPWFDESCRPDRF